MYTMTAPNDPKAILAKREEFAREYAIMKAHLATVGIEQFALEQMAMDTIFKALNILKQDDGELAPHVDSLQQHFDLYPPRTASDMRHFIAIYVQEARKLSPSPAQGFDRMLSHLLESSLTA